MTNEQIKIEADEVGLHMNSSWRLGYQNAAIKREADIKDLKITLQEIQDDKKRLTKELADMLMGSDAPPAPALCDVVSFVRSEVQDMKLPQAIKVISDALESDQALRESWETTLQRIFLAAQKKYEAPLYDWSQKEISQAQAFKQAAQSFISLIFSK